MELVRLAIMALAEAKKLQDDARANGIELVLDHNEQTCTRGCAVTVEVLGKSEDVQNIAQLYQENFKKLTDGLEVNWELLNSVFDPSKESATCPACGYEFSTGHSECPDCGLVLA